MYYNAVVIIKLFTSFALYLLSFCYVPAALLLKSTWIRAGVPINCVHGVLEDALLCSFKKPKKTQSNHINLKISYSYKRKEIQLCAFAFTQQPFETRIINKQCYNNIMRLRSIELYTTNKQPSTVQYGRSQRFTT